jgi:hypothetical protein
VLSDKYREKNTRTFEEEICTFLRRRRRDMFQLRLMPTYMRVRYGSPEKCSAANAGQSSEAREGWE